MPFPDRDLNKYMYKTAPRANFNLYRRARNCSRIVVELRLRKRKCLDEPSNKFYLPLTPVQKILLTLGRLPSCSLVINVSRKTDAHPETDPTTRSCWANEAAASSDSAV